jgi:hypothetical protein
VDHKSTEGIIFTMHFPMATVKKKCIRGQPETVEELRLRARITEAVEGKHFEQFLDNFC